MVISFCNMQYVLFMPPLATAAAAFKLDYSQSRQDEPVVKLTDRVEGE